MSPHRFFSLASFYLCALSAVFATTAHASSLVWDTTEARIELKPDQEEARAIFKVTNEGDKTVRIARIKTTCGCTGSILNKKIIEPGETAEIVGTFHKGKRQGLNHNKLEVFLDSQADSVATLHMIVQIPTLIDLQPKIIYWNASSSKTERSVRVKLDKRYVNKITEITYNRDKVDVIEEAGSESSEGSDYMTLRITPKSFDSVLRETIRLQAKGSDGTSADARLHVFVQP